MSKIAKSAKGKLFHVINIALNLAGSEKLEWQMRIVHRLTLALWQLLAWLLQLGGLCTRRREEVRGE